MRIIIDLDADRKRGMVRVRMRRYANGADGVKICNAGPETYNLIRDALASCTEGADIVDEGGGAMSRKPRPCAVCHKFDHGRCKKGRTALKCYHIKGCFVEVEKS